MRLLTSLSEQQPALKLVSYLAVEGIQTTLEDDEGAWEIWVNHDDDREQAKSILAEFEKDPDHERYAMAERKVRNTLKEAGRLLEKNQKQADRLKKRWDGSWWHCHPATYIIIGLCILVVLICSKPAPPRGMSLLPLCNKTDSVLLGKLRILPDTIPGDTAVKVMNDFDVEFNFNFMQEDQAPPLVLLLGANPLRSPDLPPTKDSTPFAWRKFRATMRLVWFTLASGEIWRPVGPIFIHLSALHIFFNMMWFKNLGEAVEFVRGTTRFLILCLIIAILSNVAQLYWSGPRFGGMSGVVFGLIGYVWMKGKTQPELGIGLTHRTITFAIFWLVLCMGGAFGPIANAAHLVGFVVGILVGARQAIYKKLPFVR